MTVIRNLSDKPLFRSVKEISISSENREILIRREPPGKGFRHFLTRKTVRSFIELLPQWEDITSGLDYILLARAEPGCDGWYDGKVVAISAWEQDCWRSVPSDYFAEHKLVLKRLNVETVKIGRNYLCKFNPSSVKAFQLLHVLLHELGHHFDRISSFSKKTSSRGEVYAEKYAASYEELVWERYGDRFL